MPGTARLSRKRGTEVTRIWDRIGELGRLKPGWLDGIGEAPSPQALLRAGIIADALPQQQEPVRIYPTEAGGVNLEWSDANLSHSITVGPDLRLYLMTVDRDEKDHGEAVARLLQYADIGFPVRGPDGVTLSVEQLRFAARLIEKDGNP
jgi:hypothetical protein